jgi:glutathione S-transferase
MSDLILHSYDESPFTQRVLRMLGIKNLTWRWVRTPMMPPKDDLVALTGGYRGTPVLQVGADVYIDSQRIARELERRHPTPSLFAEGNEDLAYAAVKWADAFFRAGLNLAIGTTGAAWPEPFRRDREGLFPDIDFARVDVDHARSQLVAHAGFIEHQLADGRAYLAGSSPGLLDVHAWTVPWFTRASVPGVNELLGCFERLPRWEARVAALGEGTRVPCTVDEAFEASRRARPEQCDSRFTGAAGLTSGREVAVEPDDTRRGAVHGRLEALDWNEIVIRRRHERCGELLVHFPRLGYRVTPLERA